MPHGGTLAAVSSGSFLERNRRSLHFALLGISCVAAGIYSASLGTDANWDLKNYHLYNPFAFFENRLFYDVAPGELQTYFSPLFDLHYYLLFKYLNDWPRLVAFIQGIPAGIFAYLTFRVSLVVSTAVMGSGPTPWACAALATALGMTGAGVAPLIGLQTGDIQMGVMALASLAIVLDCLQHPGPKAWRLGAAGLLAGIGLAGKMTAIIYCAPLGLLVLVMFRLRDAAVFGFAMVVAFLALWGPYGWRLWIEFGNPLFPYYNDIFRSPDWLPIRLVTFRVQPLSILQLIFFPFLWTYPGYGLVTEIEMQDLRLSLLFVALALGAIVGFWRLVKSAIRRSFQDTVAMVRAGFSEDRTQIALILFLVFSYFLWLELFAIYRFLIVVEALTGAGLIVVAGGIFRHHAVPVLCVLAAAAIVANVFIVRPGWGRAPFGKHVIYVEPMPVAPGSLVVIADDWPHGFVVPLLPPDTQVINIYSNFIKPGESYGLNRRMTELVRSHVGPFATISAPEVPEAVVKDRLAQYGLSERDCVVLATNIAGLLRICQAFR